MTHWHERLGPFALGAAVALLAHDAGFAQGDTCKNRGQLDTLYCDEDGDLVADVPKDAKKWRDPATLVFAYTPVEDPALYQNIFKPFTDYLAAYDAEARREAYALAKRQPKQ
jgi:phosphonate transport system substrate-binding protein